MTPAERDAAIRRGMQAAQKALYALDEEGAAALLRLYGWAQERIALEIQQRAGADGSLALEQLEALRQQVGAVLQRLESGRNSLLKDGLDRAAQIGSESLASVTVSSASTMRVPDEAVRFVRALVGADGLQLSDRLWRIDRGARDAVINAIERAVIMGHSAAQAAREFLSRGQAVPADVQSKQQAANATVITRDAKEIMVGKDGGSGAVAQAMRVFRTEINRAHGVAYLKEAEQVPGFRGIRFTLSPNHPKPDICDEHATLDRFGLGEGVFPSLDEFLKVWPAHPNTFSFPVAVFGPA